MSVVQERDILAEILIAVTALPGAFVVRANTGTARTPDGRLVRFGRPGQPDVVGCIRGRYVGIEAKTPNGRQSEAQKNYQAAIERAGGIYIIARSADEAISALAVIP